MLGLTWSGESHGSGRHHELSMSMMMSTGRRAAGTAANDRFAGGQPQRAWIGSALQGGMEAMEDILWLLSVEKLAEVREAVSIHESKDTRV